MESIDPCSLQMLHIAAHIDIIVRVIKPELNSGRWIVLDRYWWSTYVYGLCAGLGKFELKHMINVEKCSWGDLVPDVLFHITSKTPLRGDVKNCLDWQNKCQTYQTLCLREAGAFEIITVETTAGAQARCLEHLCRRVDALLEGYL